MSLSQHPQRLRDRYERRYRETLIRGIEAYSLDLQKFGDRAAAEAANRNYMADMMATATYEIGADDAAKLLDHLAEQIRPGRLDDHAPSSLSKFENIGYTGSYFDD